MRDDYNYRAPCAGITSRDILGRHCGDDMGDEMDTDKSAYFWPTTTGDDYTALHFSGPNNSTLFTDCCGCAVTDREHKCPRCGVLVWPQEPMDRFYFVFHKNGGR